MPIIDPSLQYYLLTNDSKQKTGKNSYAFFLKYLQIASRNINRNQSTMDTYFQFKKDLQASLSFVNDEFGCNFSLINDFENQQITDYYKHLFNGINFPNKLQESKKNIGTYKISNDEFNTRFYQPNILFSEFHSWYFSDTPIAILCINSDKFSSINDEINKKKVLQYIKLEIDLMAASGLTLVLCYNGNPSTETLLYQIIEDDQFSELHINIYDKKFLKKFLIFTKNRYFNTSNFLKGYIYLYSHFFKENSGGWLLMKIFKKIPRIQNISFSLPANESLIQINFISTKPFPHCKTGFDSEYLRIYLSYVPIYSKSKKSHSKQTLSNEISGLCLGYISPSDFLYQNKKQINILLDDENHKNINNFVNFDDIHFVRPDLFVNNTLVLSPIDSEMHKSIELVQEKVDQKFENVENLQKHYIHNNSMKNYLKVVRRVIYAYTFFMRQKGKEDFTIRKTQIYAVLEACQSFFEKDKNKEESKGAVYQLKTGEGKSCVITIIAAVLAIKNIIVHVVSSNIKLCIRDYLESLEFFKLLKLESAVLSHKNELPEIDKNNFPDKFFNDDLFNNPSRMNFSVCGIDNNNSSSNNKANIVFSTFVNFECFYLHLMENSPADIDFKKYGLLIDEVDSILIDEITNGTIVSREMNSNAKDILSYVYKQCKNNKTVEETFNELKNYPMCDEIQIEDIKQMYKEIDLVNSEQFCDGKKYIIETFIVKNKKRIMNFLKKTVQKINEIRDIKGKINEFLAENNSSDNDDSEEEEEEDNNEDELDTNKTIEFKRIIPFDYDHKGIPEPNKEFSGFIPQFISLKERDNNVSNLMFKEISIDYLYVSHPIFAKLYGNICGFTGTVGNKSDKVIFSTQYNLLTKKIPRHKPNLRVDFPMIACTNIQERNEKIVDEVLMFHQKGNPVLVIFEDFNEISSVYKMIKESFSQQQQDQFIEINIFNGKDESLKPDFVAGIKGAISLGTNICGRGTDIKCSTEFPLHVIVSYYSSNKRVMEQAFGRTARNGRIGTCHCICLKSQLCKKSLLNNKKIENIMDKIQLKTKLQNEYINEFKTSMSWLFEFEIKKQSYSKNTEYIDKLKGLRSSKINVNRIVAYKFKFPIFMSYKTFLKIQAQKIFSLFNCPNCKYTWRIFQRYLREMILQSWTLMIKKFDQQNKDKPFFEYKEKLELEKRNLNECLERYISNNTKNDMVLTFVNICNEVLKEYESKVFDSFKTKKFYKCIKNSTSTICIQLGFKPYSLLDKSGARITNENIDETNFIQDPELSYERKNSLKKSLSITERVDQIFNMICSKVSSMLGEKFFLKFFLRRTLAGCEFGICLDINLINNELENDHYLLVDKNPLLVFTIYLWSIYPLLAGFLIIGLVYLASISKTIFEYISCLPAKITETIIKKINDFVPEAGKFVFEKIIEFLEKVLEKQKNELDPIKDEVFLNIINNIQEIFKTGDKTVEKFTKSISKLLGDKIKIPSKIRNTMGEFINGPLLLQISILLILCFATFIRRFIPDNKKAIKNSKTDSNAYDSSLNKKQGNESLEKICENKEKEISIKEKMPKMNQTKEKEFTQSFNEIESELLKQIPSNVSELEIKFSGIIVSKKDSDFCYHKSTKKICRRIFYSNITKEFFDHVLFFSKYNQHPVFLPFVGYVLNHQNSFLLFDSKNNECLDYYCLSEFENKKFSSFEEALIFVYGISCGLEIIQNNKIVQNHILDPNNIIMYRDVYPFIIGLESNKSNPRYLPPELIKNPDRKSLKSNIFILGMLMFIMSENIFCDINQFLFDKTDFWSIFGEKSDYKSDYGDVWTKLVVKCLSKSPSKRPSFSEICNIIEVNYNKPEFVMLQNYIEILKPYRSSDH